MSEDEEKIDQKEEISEKSSDSDEDETVRINVSLPKAKKDEWKNLASKFSTSVSQLIRNAMEKFEEGMENIDSIEVLGEKLDHMGADIEKILKESGLEDLGDKIERQFNKKKIKPILKEQISPKIDKDRIKQRVKGLIQIQKSLPIEKLAQALNKTKEEAENLIYELAAEGIDGILENGVFKFKDDPEVVISNLFDLIDKM